MTSITRRHLLKASAGSAALAIFPQPLAAEAKPANDGPAPEGGSSMIGVADSLMKVSNAPVKIASLDLLRSGGHYFVRARSTDGAVGIAATNERVEYLYPILLQRVIPYFLNKDARRLPEWVEGVYPNASNYKLAGLPFWNCVAWVEFSLLDLLGRMADKPVGELLGGMVRKKVPVYLSSLRRDTTPEQEVAWLAEALEKTGATAVKLKIGGRMSKNRDASPGRTDCLVPLARKTFGDAVAIYVDANGSYDAPHAIEVGKMLQDHGVGFYEEPCEWEDYEATKRVADALDVPVAGGEQDSSLYRWREMTRDRVVDIVQPDMTYNGGLLRAIQVAEMAAAQGMTIVPHSPKADENEGYLLHFISRTPNAGPHHEYSAAAGGGVSGFRPPLKVKDGAIEVPTGPGWGFAIDPKDLENAEKVER